MNDVGFAKGGGDTGCCCSFGSNLCTRPRYKDLQEYYEERKNLILTIPLSFLFPEYQR